jgi:superfamily II DNA or RNA helicase
MNPEFSLRPYQQEAVDAVVKGFSEFQKQLLICPTGGGKTIQFASLSEKEQGRVLILAHREELLQQAQDKIARATGLVAELEAADASASLGAKIVVGSVQTLMRDGRRAKFPRDHFSLVVVDEAHHTLADSYQKVLGHFNGNTKVLGVTATPDRGDKQLLSDYFENIAHETTLVELINQGYLSRIRVKNIPLRIDISGVKQVAGDYSADQLGHALEPYLEEIANHVAFSLADRKTLCFLPLCRLSEQFVELMQARGIAAEHVEGTSPDRREILERFKSGETRLVSNAMLWTEGFDEPTIDCILPLRPTKIRSLYAQQVGRGTRIHPGKDHLLLVDFLWLTSRHNLVRPGSLVAQDEDEADALAGMGDGDLMEQQEQHQHDILEERKQKLAAWLRSNQKRAEQDYDLLEFATGIEDNSLLDYQPTMRWHHDPMTEPQRAKLAQLGFNVDAIKDKGHASLIMAKVVMRIQNGLCSFKQARLLRKHGIENAFDYSFTAASAKLDQIFSRYRR